MLTSKDTYFLISMKLVPFAGLQSQERLGLLTDFYSLLQYYVFLPFLMLPLLSYEIKRHENKLKQIFPSEFNDFTLSS